MENFPPSHGIQQVFQSQKTISYAFGKNAFVFKKEYQRKTLFLKNLVLLYEWVKRPFDSMENFSEFETDLCLNKIFRTLKERHAAAGEHWNFWVKQHEWLLSFPSLLLVIGIMLSHISALQRFSAFQICKLTAAVNLDFTRDLELPFFVFACFCLIDQSERWAIQWSSNKSRPSRPPLPACLVTVQSFYYNEIWLVGR